MIGMEKHVIEKYVIDIYNAGGKRPKTVYPTGDIGGHGVNDDSDIPRIQIFRCDFFGRHNRRGPNKCF